ncbi:glutamate-5-semialdehyde dehydrogenase [Chamaesiphon minutus]|uniref:Gamma-glutamyl phosphate reductase n=1 Tax=Chamaesiphon minutus (strain ATCC 27169 / PCC 6605) TaxID=1173020 RepID=K9UJX8_CHAP6|nr:glutamate-5-semialdehyde dehydrogenase [Chamaesiphon minutus]AFY95125.1 gamma-glutamyl phosphate reductase [Chamaesiphon minutus PCC 6605]
MLTEIAQKTRLAAQQLASLSATAKNAAIEAIAASLEHYAAEIVAANAIDCQAAEGEIAPALYARLKLDATKLKGAIVGVRDVGKLADPVGRIQIHREIDAGLIMRRVSCPVGVLGVIFEARPDAVIQIASLAIKSGNGVILKGGREAIESCTVLVRAIKAGLAQSEVDPDAIQLLTTRAETSELLKLDRYVDLIIPRGSNEFVKYVRDNTRIPVLGHADGICHLYIDREADFEKAIEIAIDAKTQYPAACNAIETLLIDRAIAGDFLPIIIDKLQAHGVEIRLSEFGHQILGNELHLTVDLAIATDWATEYSDLIIAIQIVPDLEAAIAHINTYGSRHTDSIVTENANTAKVFSDRVDAANVFHNCSTRFSDGFRYGFGAEVGISTQKMPPRGPVGLEGLVTYKYQLSGDGHIAATYTGENAKPFTHRDI